jgi:hypothetical protein
MGGDGRRRAATADDGRVAAGERRRERAARRRPAAARARRVTRATVLHPPAPAAVQCRVGWREHAAITGGRLAADRAQQCGGRGLSVSGANAEARGRSRALLPADKLMHMCLSRSAGHGSANMSLCGVVVA